MKSGSCSLAFGCGYSLTPLAKTLTQKTGGTCGVDGADQDDAAFASEDDGMLPLRNFGSVRQGDI
jgi:hypothetical protein